MPPATAPRARPQRSQPARLHAAPHAGVAGRASRCRWRSPSGCWRVSLLPRIQSNRSLTLAFWGAGGGAARVAGACWRSRSRGAGVPGFVSTPPRAAALHPDVLPSERLRLLGLLLGAGLSLRARCSSRSSSSPTPSTCCCRGRGAQPFGVGFGPFPIVFSTNLFLWFKDDWFLFQFLLIAVGFLGKAFVRWERDGRRVHIFNPSAFALALFSLVLIVTGTTS